MTKRWPWRWGGIVAVATLTGCSGWQAVQLSPAAFTPPPQEMRVTRLDGWQAVIASPRLEHDTISGVRTEAPWDSIVMPLAQVRSAAVPTRNERDAFTSVGVLAGFLAVFTGIVYFGARGSDS